MASDGLCKFREKYHISIRKRGLKEKQQESRNQRITKLTQMNIERIIDNFPQTLYDLQSQLSNIGQEETIKCLLSNHFKQLIQKMKIRDLDKFKVWMKILEYFIGYRVTNQQIFFTQYYQTYLDYTIANSKTDMMFKLLRVMSVQKLPESKYADLVKIVQHSLKDLSKKVAANSDELKGKNAVAPQVFNFLVYITDFSRQQSLIIQHKIIPRMFCRQTIQLVKSLMFSGFKMEQHRVSAMNIFINLFYMQNLHEDYYFNFFQNNILHKMKCPMQFGSELQKVNSWKIIFNIFCQPKYRQILIQNHFHSLAAQTIIELNSAKSRTSLLMEIKSFFIFYFCNLESQEQYIEFINIEGIKAVSEILRKYQALEENELFQLLMQFGEFLNYSSYRCPNMPSPVIIFIQEQEIMSFLNDLKLHDSTEVAELANNLLLKIYQERQKGDGDQITQIIYE